jgi:hypothetical protein
MAAIDSIHCNTITNLARGPSAPNAYRNPPPFLLFTICRTLILLLELRHLGFWTIAKLKIALLLKYTITIFN